MTLSAMDQAKHLERDGQYLAALGMVYCSEHQNVLTSNIAYIIGVNILSAIICAATTTLAAHMIVPIAFGTLTLGLAVYTVISIHQRVFQQIEANRWKPVFQAMIDGRYTEAYASMKKNLDDVNRLYPDEKGGVAKYIREINLASPVNEKGRFHEFFSLLDFRLTVLNVLQDSQSDIDLVKSFPGFVRCKDRHISNAVSTIDKLREDGADFVAKKVTNVSSFIFKCIILEVKKGAKAHRQKTLEIELTHKIAHIKNFLVYLRTFREGFDQINRADLNAILNAETPQEMGTAMEQVVL